MDVIRIVGLAIVSLVAIVLVRQVKPEMSVVLTIAVSVILVFTVLDELFDVVYTFYSVAENTGVDANYFSGVLKIVGIGYLGEFCNNICVDSNCKSVGDKVLFASK
ncbi:MAG: hypothetical protein IKC47_03580, partial [Clostridia bacterium]|nr:hypothetical protein [Clostridia bacterium]